MTWLWESAEQLRITLSAKPPSRNSSPGICFWKTKEKLEFKKAWGSTQVWPKHQLSGKFAVISMWIALTKFWTLWLDLTSLRCMLSDLEMMFVLCTRWDLVEIHSEVGTSLLCEHIFNFGPCLFSRSMSRTEGLIYALHEYFGKTRNTLAREHHGYAWWPTWRHGSYRIGMQQILNSTVLYSPLRLSSVPRFCRSLAFSGTNFFRIATKLFINEWNATIFNSFVTGFYIYRGTIAC